METSRHRYGGDDQIGALVEYGYALFTDTANEIGPAAPDLARRFSGNNLTCQNCHLQARQTALCHAAGRRLGTIPAIPPARGMVDTLESRINGCMERSMNGRVLSSESHEMRAFLAYMQWLSTGIPNGVKLRRRRHVEDQRAGAQSRSRPWRTGLFQDLRGMPRRKWTRAARPNRRGVSISTSMGSRQLQQRRRNEPSLTAAAFAMHNMPFGTAFNAPVLKAEDAYDVAAYINSHKRPEKAKPEKDFPVRLQKPIDTPYGPYADDFSSDSTNSVRSGRSEPRRKNWRRWPGQRKQVSRTMDRLESDRAK